MQFRRSQLTAILCFALLLGACNRPAPLKPQLISNTPYAADSGTLLVRCGQLIDGISASPLGAKLVLIRAGRIEKIAPSIAIDEDVPVLDLSDKTCLPGLIDMHTHLLEDPETLEDLAAYFDDTYEGTVQLGREIADTTLKAGFTTVRSVGTYYGLTDIALRDEINKGETIGPRTLVAGYYLTIPGGGGDLLTPGITEEQIPPYLHMGVARGPEEFSRKTQAAIDSGVDFIKIIASGAVLAYGGVPGAHEMTLEEMQAVVKTAHAAGIKVAAHAHGAAVVKDAIMAGADTIEHASLIDDEGLALAKEHDVPLVMDVFNGDWMLEEGRKSGWPEEFMRKTEETTLVQRESFRKGVAMGTPIIFGSDAGVYTHGINATQFQYMVHWGMTPMQAIQAATSLPAGYLGWGDRTGALEVGRLGDLVAVDGDPLKEISILLNIDTVIKGGLVFAAPPERVQSP